MKRKISVLLTVSMMVSMVFGTTAFANTPDNGLYPETQEAVNALVDKYGIDGYYFDHIVDLYYENGYTDAEELNDGVMEAVDKVKETCEDTEFIYQQALAEYEDALDNKAVTRSEPYDSAMSLYSAGMGIVKAAGCPHTAESMYHAIVPQSQVGTGWTPSNLYYDHDSWGDFLTSTQGFFSVIEGIFQSDVAMSGQNMVTRTGSYEFTSANSSLDAFVQLHNVNYSVTFVKTGTYTYDCSILISDTFDFDWWPYDNIAVGFGNNYCKTVQNLGYIAPYNIYIVGDM